MLQKIAHIPRSDICPRYFRFYIFLHFKIVALLDTALTTRQLVHFIVLAIILWLSNYAHFPKQKKPGICT